MRCGLVEPLWQTTLLGAVDRCDDLFAHGFGAGDDLPKPEGAGFILRDYFDGTNPDDPL